MYGSHTSLREVQGSVLVVKDTKKRCLSHLGFNLITTVIIDMATAEFTMGCDVIIDIFAQNIESLRDKLIVIKVLDSESNWPEA